MPEVQEVFRMATQKVRPEPGALERQFRGQRKRLTRRKAGAVGLAAALAISAAVVAIQASRDPGQGGGTVPAEEGSTAPRVTVGSYGFGFSADGSRLFADARAGGGVAYDAATGETLQSVEGERGNATVAFSPDGELFISVHGGESISVLDTYVNVTATGEELWHFQKACCFAAFSPDGRLLALPFAGHTRVVDLETGEPVNEFDAFGNFAFSPDGQQLMVSSGEEGIVAYVFDVESGGDPVLTLQGDNDGDPLGTMLAWSPDGSTLVTAAVDGDAILWDADTGEEKFAFSSPAGRFTSLAFGSDPVHLATGSSNGTATVWELSTDDAQHIFTRDAHIGTQEWLTVALSPDGTQLMTTSALNETKVWNVVPD